MKMTKHKPRPLYRAGVFFMFLFMITHGKTVIAQSALQMRDGVVVDAGRSMVYLLNPQKKLEAVSLATGQVAWTSSDSLKPLAIVDQNLLVQAISRGNRLVLLQLDVNQRGRVLTRDSIALPANIKADYRPSINTAFNSYARLVNGEAYVLWEYYKTMLKGRYDEDEREDTLQAMQTGIIRVTKNTGRLIPAQKSAIPTAQLNRSIKPGRNEGFGKGKEQEYFSADQNHILSSLRMLRKNEFNNYRWQVFVRSTRNKVGELEDYRAYAPFMVTGSTLIYEIGPYERLVNGKVQEVPLYIVAVDLAAGKELWRRPVFDSVMRTNLPPGAE